MQVAAVQTAFNPDLTIDQRRSEGLKATEQALRDGANFVVLPELWIHGAWDVDEWSNTGESLNAQDATAPTLTALTDLAIAYQTPIFGGSILEQTPDGTKHNTAVLIDRDGTLAATYRKIHLFGFNEGESAHIQAGTKPATGTVTIAGRPTQVGLGICYDLRFPELFRMQRSQGAEILALGAAWPAARVDAWQLLNRARAAENQAHVIATNQAGHQNETLLAAASAIIDPLGNPIEQTSPCDNNNPATGHTITAELDLDRQTTLRAKAPFEQDRVITLQAPESH